MQVNLSISLAVKNNSLVSHNVLPENSISLLDNTFPNSFFVYGTLRPDIKTEEYFNDVHKNEHFQLTYNKAYLPHCKLFYSKTFKYPVAIYNPLLYSKDQTVLGYLLTTNNLKKTLETLDYIEEYPEVYDRIIVSCFDADDKEKEYKAHFYTIRNEQIDEELEDVIVNDWSLYISVKI
jgi:gamma-glutamylcyclotransferase (GGCT)/AIG2-like uncharacterized protein YtfP